MANTRAPLALRVSTDGDAGPYIMVPVGLLESVKNVLDENRVSYWVDEEAISLDGKPEIAVVNLHRQSDAATVQELLNNVLP